MNKRRILLTLLEVKHSHYSAEILLLDNHALQHRNTWSIAGNRYWSILVN